MKRSLITIGRFSHRWAWLSWLGLTVLACIADNAIFAAICAFVCAISLIRCIDEHREEGAR